MVETPNHGYNVPERGRQDWHVPLNENFEFVDADVEIRDLDENRDEYEPTDGAKFLATDLGIVYFGDGTEWIPTLVQGRYGPSGDPATAGNVVFGHPTNGGTDAVGATISGGGGDSQGEDLFPNEVTGDYGTIGGGAGNTAGGAGGTIGGGGGNEVTGDVATVGGGGGNRATRLSATVGGGLENAAVGGTATVAGGTNNRAGDDTEENVNATVGGGGGNEARGAHSTVSGGLENVAVGGTATVAGGTNNRAGDDGISATVGGGGGNEATGRHATVGGGLENEAVEESTTVAGGTENTAEGVVATVGGGGGNAARAVGATIPGGIDNEANAGLSFAVGRAAKANHEGAFVIGNSSEEPVESRNPHEVRSQMAMWAPAFNMTSTRAAKTDVEPVEPGSVLERVESLDVNTWTFREHDTGRHMGPMAEDFYETFGLGDDDESIGSVDADGVALAAIQGLSRKLEEKDERIETLEARNDDLRDRVAALEDHLGVTPTERDAEDSGGSHERT